MRLDPRTKLLILAVTSVSVFMNKSIAVECVLAGIPLVLLSVSGNLKRMLKYAAFFLALLLIQLFIVPRLPVTFGGIVYMFAVYIRKLLPCFMLGSFLLATTSVSKFLAAITKLRLSKGLTIALAITLRYFPTMREEWASIRDAMALRGISASAAGLISHPIQTMEHVYVPLLVSASRISDEIIRMPVYLSDRTEHVTAEIQIRTIAMDFWASLEHDIRYKVDKTKLPEGINEEMLECSGKIAEIDRKMQDMYRRIKAAEKDTASPALSEPKKQDRE